MFWRTHLPWPLPADVVFAIALESIAVFLAFHAHLAQLADDSALKLRLASYGFGAIIGVLNASHYLVNGRLTAAALGMGLMSASSPWLWAVHSRRANRDRLREAGLIEAHAMRIGQTRFMWHPVRSVRVMRFAAWDGIRRPDEAIPLWEKHTGQRASARHKTETVSGGDVRAWARSQGMQVSDTGRIPANIRAAYEAGQAPDTGPRVVQPVSSPQPPDPDATVTFPRIQVDDDNDDDGPDYIRVASGGRYPVRARQKTRFDR